MNKEAQITVSILSWLLEDRLIKTLKNLPLTTSMPLNLCLHVQGEEQISRDKRREIYAAASGFARQDIYFTPFNNGVATPRETLLKRSAGTPYVFITDNDMDFTKGSIDALYSFLEDSKNNSYGAVNLVDNTLVWHRRVDLAHKRVTYFPVSLKPSKVVDIDLCGACSTLIRSEVAQVPNIIDTNYYLGTWDIDLCMNIKKLGLKLATICDKHYIAYNDTSCRTKEYLKIKGPTPIRIKGIHRFMDKWNISSEIDRDEALGIKVDLTDTAIITRSIYTSLGDKPGVGVLTKGRLKNMQNFFINSLKNQTDKEFTLYLYVGSKYNEATKAIKSLNWGKLNVKFIYTDNSLNKWQKHVEKSGNWGRENDPGCPEEIVRTFEHPKHTIMARLDNDDWVAPGWIVHMKHMSTSIDEPRFLINYQVIGQAPDGRLFNFFMKHIHFHTSPFLAIVQKDSPKMSPYADVHLKMGNLFDTVYTIRPSYVFMVIGSDNRSNRIYKDDRFFEDIAIERLKNERMKGNIIKLKPKAKAKPNKFRPQRTNWRARIANASFN
jgi:GT2 family glycosyltransferase